MLGSERDVVPGSLASVVVYRFRMSRFRLIANAVMATGLFLHAMGCSGPEATEFLQTRANAFVRGDPEAGVILAIERPKELIAVSAGKQSDGTFIPATGRVRIGSVTKTFMAVLVLQLADDEKIDLDAPAGQYLRQPSLGEDITVRDLLQHTSGLPGDAQPGFKERVNESPKQPLTPEEILSFTRGVPRLFEPGERWSYSNTNYIYLGLIIEKVSAKPLAEVLRERITAPLDLEDTYLAGAEDGPPVIRTPIDLDGQAKPYDYPYEAIATSAWASGALVSTAADVHKFFTALFDGRLTSEMALRSMKVVAPGSETRKPPSGYGLGLTEWHPDEFPGRKLYGHGGGVPGFLTLAFHDPTTKTTYFAAGTSLGWDFKPTMLDMIGLNAES